MHLRTGKSSLAASLAFLLGLSMSITAAAMDTFLVGPRATAMGGASVASPVDTAAQYYNPAAFGFFADNDEKGESVSQVDNNDIGRKDWGFDFNATGGYRQHNQFGKYVDDLSTIDYELLSSTGVQTRADLEKLIRLARDLEGLDDPGNAATASANGGLGVRVGHVGIGGRAFFQATGRVIDLDTTNLGLSVNGADLTADISGVWMPAAYVSSGYTLQIFDSSQYNQLLAAGLDNEAIQRLDYLTAQEGITPTEVQGTVDVLTTVTSQSGTSTLDDNTTMVLLTGFGVAEVPISYGYAINDHISVGGNLKLMRGRVYANQVLVFNNDSGDTISKSDELYEQTTTFGIDLGVLARFKMVNVGLVGRNLNSPKFDGPTLTINSTTTKFDDVRINPQFTAGIAIIPIKTLTLEADIDLTDNKTTLTDYETQNVALGLEWDAFRFLALRAGAYKNLVESDIGWVYTAGFGLNLWAVRLDAGFAFSEEEERFDDEDYPRELQGSALLSVDF